MQSVDIKTIQEQAEGGNIEASLQLGKLRLTQERYDDAAVWLLKAANANNVEAQFLYGSMLAEGLGVDQDTEAAAYWLKRSAEQGHSGAQVQLGLSFESGNGVPLNLSVAGNWYRKAAEQGDKIAQYKYGHMVHNGLGAVQDLTEATQWLRKAAEAGVADAQLELVECLIESSSAQPQEVFHWAHAAAKSGTAKAQHQLGWVYENAPEHLRNLDEAVKWYRLSAEQGNTDSQMRLAKLYAEGKIVAQSSAEAEHWLNLAVASGESTKSKEVTDTNEKLAAIAPFVTVNEYPPGSIIDNKYFIMSVLGKGGICVVYKAKHLLMNKMVALKMLKPESASNPSMVQRFQREAQAAASLSHPNVISIFDLGMSPDGKPFMVMDYLEGESLEQRIEGGRYIPVVNFLSIFMQVCSALTAAHEAGIVHRDIKPSNIMLTVQKSQPDVVKVVDFGLAKLLEPGEQDAKLTKSGEVFGTLMYMSPEQCLGHPLDARTDIYSLGCTMYEALTGKPVHFGTSAFDVMSKHIHAEPARFKDAAPELGLPDDLERIILRAIAKGREDRYQSASDLGTELMNFLAKS